MSLGVKGCNLNNAAVFLVDNVSLEVIEILRMTLLGSLRKGMMYSVY